jgi:hypothetical protein
MFFIYLYFYVLILISGGRNLGGQSEEQLQDRRRYVGLYNAKKVDFIFIFILFCYHCLSHVNFKNTLENKHKNN